MTSYFRYKVNLTIVFSAKMRPGGVSLKVLTVRKKRNLIRTPMLKKGITLVACFLSRAHC